MPSDYYNRRSSGTNRPDLGGAWRAGPIDAGYAGTGLRDLTGAGMDRSDPLAELGGSPQQIRHPVTGAMVDVGGTAFNDLIEAARSGAGSGPNLRTGYAGTNGGNLGAIGLGPDNNTGTSYYNSAVMNALPISNAGTPPSPSMAEAQAITDIGGAWRNPSPDLGGAWRDSSPAVNTGVSGFTGQPPATVAPSPTGVSGFADQARAIATMQPGRPDVRSIPPVPTMAEAQRPNPPITTGVSGFTGQAAATPAPVTPGVSGFADQASAAPLIQPGRPDVRDTPPPVSSPPTGVSGFTGQAGETSLIQPGRPDVRDTPPPVSPPTGVSGFTGQAPVTPPADVGGAWRDPAPVPQVGVSGMPGQPGVTGTSYYDSPIMNATPVGGGSDYYDTPPTTGVDTSYLDSPVATPTEDYGDETYAERMARMEREQGASVETRDMVERARRNAERAAEIERTNQTATGAYNAANQDTVGGAWRDDAANQDTVGGAWRDTGGQSPPSGAPDYYGTPERSGAPDYYGAPETGTPPPYDPAIDNDAPVPGLEPGDQAFQYNAPVLPGMAQLPEQRQALWDMMTGQTSVPYLDKIMAGARDRQARELDYMKGGLANRGILNSTPGFDRIAELGRGHDAANAQAALQALGIVSPQMQGAITSTYDQDMGIDKQAYDQWSDQTRLQSDLDFRRDQQANTSMDQMLRAIQGMQVNPQMPGFQAPQGSQGFLGNVGEIGSNILSMPGRPWWLGG